MNMRHGEPQNKSGRLEGEIRQFLLPRIGKRSSTIQPVSNSRYWLICSSFECHTDCVHTNTKSI